MDKNNNAEFHITKLISVNSYIAPRAVFVVALSFLSCFAQAEWLKEHKADSLIEALEKGKTELSFRLRYEDAKQVTQGAQALTLRSRLSFETLPYELFSAFLEFDDVRALTGDDNYNSGANGQVDDLLIEDPEGTELNQAWLAYDISNTFIKYGRQRMSLNNQRLLGGDSWRQNEQTFAGLSITNETLNYIRVEFAQLDRVYTNQAKELASAHQDINAKMLNVNYRGFWLSDLSLYALWISDHPDDDQWETSTYGIRFAGDLGGDFSIAYQLDLAQQEDAGSNALNYSVNYALLDLLFAYDGAEFGIGYELLGAKKAGFFVAPLGSHHPFQGLSDQFSLNGLGNIQGGIQDSYISLGYKAKPRLGGLSLPLSFSVAYHDFYSDRPINGVRHIGEEWVLKSQLELENYQVLLQYADYHADQFAEDERTVWLSLAATF